MEYMAGLPDKAFDLAIVDPPYFSGPEKRFFYGAKESSIGVKRFYKKSNNWVVPDAKYFDELKRVSVHYIVWGVNYYDYQFNSGRIIWDKVNDSSDYSDAEIAATSLFKHTRMFRFMWNGMLQGSSVLNGSKMQGNKKLNEIRIHPTQKPVALYRWLLHKYAKPNDKIPDTHLGSGSSAIAAHEWGGVFVGCEIDKDYYEAACKRFKEQTAQLNIFK